MSDPFVDVVRKYREADARKFKHERNDGMRIIFSLIVLLYLTGCTSPESDQAKAHDSTVSRDEAVRIAETASREAIEMPTGIQPIIEVKPDSFIITYPWQSDQNPPRPGPAYYNKVTVDRQSGDIIKMLVAP